MSGHFTQSETAFAVNSLTDKVQDLQKLLDGLDTGLTSLSASRDFVTQVAAALEEAGGITVRARDTLKSLDELDNGDKRLAELESRFRASLQKIDALVKGATINNANLLAGEATTTYLDPNGKNIITTQGIDISTAGLGFREPDFSNVEKIQDARIDVMNAIDMAVTLRHIISADIILMQTRQEFSQSTIDALNSGAQQIPVAGDVSEEAANLLSLQIRQQLSQADTSLASESQQYLLKQF